MADGVGGGSQLFGFLSSINGELYGQALSSAMSQYRIWDPSFALARDVEAYEKLNRDPVCSHAFFLRKLGAAGTRWAIVPSAPSPVAGAAAKLTEAAVGKLRDFLALRFNLGEGIVQGSRWARLWWETRRLPLPKDVAIRGQPGAKHVDLICPVVHRDVDKRRFRQYRVERPDVNRTPEGVNEDGELSYEKTVDYPWQVWRPVQRVWQDKDRVDDGGSWVHHLVDDNENSLGSGNGVADPLFTSAWARGQVIQYMLAGMEKWSQGGIMVAEIQASIQGDLAGGRYEQAKAAIVKILKAELRSGVVVVPQGDKVSLVAPSEAWLNECITVLQYFDGVITQRVLLSVLPSGGGGDKGSLARAQEEGGTQMRVTLHDRARIQDTLDADLIGTFWARNAETLALLEVMGEPLDTAAPGSIRIGSDGAREALAAAPQLCQVATIAPIRRDEFYERLGLTPPSPEDETIYLPVQQATADKLEGQADAQRAKAGEEPDPTDPSDPDDAERDRQSREDVRFAAGLEARRDMPQVKDLDALENFLREQRVPVEDDVARSGDLKASQEEINQAKVERLKEKGLKILVGRRLLTSRDGYVIDGHHWNEATRSLDPRAVVPVLKIDLPRDAAIEAVRAFPGAEFKGPRDGKVERDESREQRMEAAYVAAAVKAGLVELVAGDLDFAASVKAGRGWNLVYTWVAKDDGCTCKGCDYLAQVGPFTWGTLPTFPGTADTPCRERCRCILRARPASKDEHEKLSRRLGAGQRLERIEALTGWVPPSLRTVRQTKS
jgi:hypothetical protein